MENAIEAAFAKRVNTILPGVYEDPFLVTTSEENVGKSILWILFGMCSGQNSQNHLISRAYALKLPREWFKQHIGCLLKPLMDIIRGDEDDWVFRRFAEMVEPIDVEIFEKVIDIGLHSFNEDVLQAATEMQEQKKSKSK